MVGRKDQAWPRPELLLQPHLHQIVDGAAIGGHQVVDGCRPGAVKDELELVGAGVHAPARGKHGPHVFLTKKVSDELC